VRDVPQLGKAPDRVAHPGEDERRAAEAHPHGEVEQEAGQEAGRRPGEAAAEQRDRPDDDRDDVGPAAENRELGDHRDLDEHGDEHQPTDARGGLPGDRHWAGTSARAPRPTSVSTWTKSIRLSSANGSMWIVW
jgi:hypothetical protein